MQSPPNREYNQSNLTKMSIKRLWVGKRVTYNGEPCLHNHYKVETQCFPRNLLQLLPVSNCEWSAPIFSPPLLHASLSPFHVDYAMQASPPNGQWHLRIPPHQGFIIITTLKSPLLTHPKHFLLNDFIVNCLNKFVFNLVAQKHMWGYDYECSDIYHEDWSNTISSVEMHP